LTVTYNSNDYEESTWTPKILIEEERGIGIELREISKDQIPDNNVEEATIRKNALEGCRYRALSVDHSAIDFTSVFKVEQIVKASNG